MINLKTLNSNMIRVNFSTIGMQTLLSKPSNISEKTIAKPAILQLAQTVQTPAPPRTPARPKRFVSRPELRGIDYVGYVIEKERLDQNTGQWHRIENYKIIGSGASSFTDTRVAYGQIYRYRMKTILKFTAPQTITTTESYDNLTQLNQVHDTAIDDLLKLNLPKLQTLTQNKLVSTKTSAGVVQPSINLSSNISLSLKNEQSILTKQIANSSNQTLNDNKISLQKAVNDLVLSQKTTQTTKTDEYYSCYYESLPSKSWLTVKIEENVPPPTVSNWQVLPRTLDNKILIMWLKPANDQRDIQAFNLYRRNAVGQEWVKIASNLPQNINSFEDTNVKIRTKYIYAISCVDVHGLESYLSSQYEAELNPNIIFEKQEIPIKFVSGPGLRPDEIGKTIRRFGLRQPPIVAYKNIQLKPSLTLNGTNRQVIVRITSLDTHEQQNLNVNVSNKTISTK